MTKFAPHKALKSFAYGKLTFDASQVLDKRVVVHRVGRRPAPTFDQTGQRSVWGGGWGSV